MATIENLEIEISANAEKASSGLRSLASALRSLEKVVAKIDFTSISANLTNLSNAINMIGEAEITRVIRLGDALENLNQASRTKFDTKTISNLEKVSKIADKTQKSIGSMNRGMNTFMGRIKKIAMYRLIRSIMKMISQAVIQGFQAYSKYQYQTNNDKKYVKNMTELTYQLQSLKYTVGALTGSVMNQLAPTFSALLSVLVEVTNHFNNLIASATKSEHYYKVNVEYLREYVDSLKQAKREMLGIDEINIFKNDIDNERLYTKETTNKLEAWADEKTLMMALAGAYVLLNSRTGLLTRAFNRKNVALDAQTAKVGSEVSALMGAGGLAWAFSGAMQGAKDLTHTLETNPIQVEVDSTALEELSKQLEELNAKPNIQVETNLKPIPSAIGKPTEVNTSPTPSVFDGLVKGDKELEIKGIEIVKEAWENIKDVAGKVIKLLPSGLLSFLAGQTIGGAIMPSTNFGTIPMGGFGGVSMNFEGLADSISNGVVNALNATNTNNDTQQVLVYLDGNVIYDNVVSKNRTTILRTGTNPMGVM